MRYNTVYAVHFLVLDIPSGGLHWLCFVCLLPCDGKEHVAVHVIVFWVQTDILHSAGNRSFFSSALYP